jgi:hypothetical protein
MARGFAGAVLRARVGRVAGIGAVALAAIAASAALAGDDGLGTAGGVSYVHDASSPSTPSVAVLEAECPPGTQVSGGGFEIGTSAEFGSLNDSAPADGTDPGAVPDDAWFVSVHYPDSEILPNPDVYAICEEPEHGRETESVPVPAGESGTTGVLCDELGKVTGGGATLSGDEDEAFVSSSYPIDDQDEGRRPDDGWGARAYNASGETKTLSVTALCRHGSLRYDRFRKRTRNNGFAGAPAGCRVRGSQRLLGAGWRFGGNAAEAEVEDVVPKDSFDANSVPDDYAGIYGHDFDPRRRFTGFAVCKR